MFLMGLLPDVNPLDYRAMRKVESGFDNQTPLLRS